jgi:GNAT superfamily N-acetyltransferase
MRGFVESSSSETLARSLTTIKERQGLVLVADWDGEVAGVLAFQIIPLFHIAGDLGRITALVVSSRLEQRGIGRRLVAAAERFGWERGCARIEITSGDHRPGAHAFYEAIGYRVDTRRFVKSRP